MSRVHKMEGKKKLKNEQHISFIFLLTGNDCVPLSEFLIKAVIRECLCMPNRCVKGMFECFLVNAK